MSILSEAAPLTFIGFLGFRSGNKVNKFEKDIHYKIGLTDAPIVLDYAVSYREAELASAMDCGTHTIFFGKVVDSDIIDSQAVPMTYEHYLKVKKGKSRKNAPTYMG